MMGTEAGLLRLQRGKEEEVGYSEAGGCHVCIYVHCPTTRRVVRRTGLLDELGQKWRAIF